MCDDPLEKLPILDDFRLDHFSVVEGPLMPVRMELNVNTRIGEAAELLLVHEPEQLLAFDLVERDIQSVGHFL